jgi:hypothetical protein
MASLTLVDGLTSIGELTVSLLGGLGGLGILVRVLVEPGAARV